MAMLEIPGTSREKVPTSIYSDHHDAILEVANKICTRVVEHQQHGRMLVLGLAAGNTPLGLFDELVRRHREEGLSFRNVIAFNLGEYYLIDPHSPQSFHSYMRRHFFDHVDILPENIHLFDGNVGIDKAHQYCHDVETKITEVGGIDMMILSVGRSGHIGFNEPGSSARSVTRVVKLAYNTIEDAREHFIKEEYVPLRALTMGISTILQSRHIVLLAWGERKASVVRDVVEGPVTDQLPATFLQNHPNVEAYVDYWAAAQLTRVKYPWLVGMCRWDDKLTLRAVIWLSEKVDKPILRLTDEDYKDNHLGDLVINYGSYYQLNKYVFDQLNSTITGWPGGKPNTDDARRPERAEPARKRVVIFSPHPDDDVISMGGTFLRLVEQGHDVHVAYQTSGNIAVHDDDALRFAAFARDLACESDGEEASVRDLYQEVAASLESKQQGDVDAPVVRKIKGLIRKGEAMAACRYFGLTQDNVHFLNLPFYETGTVAKAPLGEGDINIVKALLDKVQPHQVYAAGDLRDPHGTHRVCLEAVFAALRSIKQDEPPWIANCWLWLYRGAWQEWDINEIQMAVPISPDELLRKRKAIFKHQSQKDEPVFQGSDKREFWQRAEDRNKLTARLYDKLGLTEYEAIEAFVRHHF
jgi:glucosamine-6-phosphate deaminase